MFPFLNGQREIRITRLQLLIQAPDHATIGEYIRVKCQKTRHRHRSIDNGYDDEDEIIEFDCVLASKYPGLYLGALDIQFKVPSMSLVHQNRDEFGRFSFPSEMCVEEVREAYILVKYEYIDGRKGGPGHKSWVMREQEDMTSQKRRRYDHWDDDMGGLDGEEVRMSPDL
jgi:hypothetical protein